MKKVLTILLILSLLIPVAAQAVVGSIEFIWDSPAPDSAPVEGYRVYRSPTAGGPYLVASDDLPPTARSVVLANQELDAPMYYVLRAFNSFGESQPSNEVITGRPSAPTNFQATIAP